MTTIKQYLPSWKTIKLVSFITVLYMLVYGIFVYMKEIAAAIITFIILRRIVSCDESKPVSK